MKNLFKNLMLVAVAAMAFTACQNDSNEVNEVAKKTVITGVATIDADDTRSGFVGKNEAGDAYVSEWDGGEYIRLFYSGWSDYTEIDAEGNFELDYIGDFDPGATATVCSPYDSWNTVNEYVIPEPQTPRENSVDPMAHILKSDATEIINGTLSVKMKHAVAYGKVSFPELSLDGDAVSNVVLDIDGAEYTINTSATQNIWFACKPNGTVSNMTVTVNTNGGQALYKKIIENGNKNLSFDKGIVSTFNVKGLEQKPTEPEEPESIVFNQASVTGNEGDVFAYFNTANGDNLKLNPYNVFVDGTWPVGTHAIQAAFGYVYPGLGQHYSTYNGVDIEGGEIVVSVKNNKYYIEFNNFVDGYGNILIKKAIFEGEIEGLVVPDTRVSLAIPSNLKATVSGKTITLTWSPVENADGYKVWMFNPVEEAITEIVEDTQFVFEAQLVNETYNFNVYSYASDENPTYKTSTNWVTVTATTEDTDPKMEVSVESLKFKAAGETKEFTVTLKHFTADINVTHDDNEWLTIVPNGNTFTVTAVANDVEEKRNDTIVITAGDFTKQISVEQAAKQAEGVAELGSIDNPYVFDTHEFLPGPDLSLRCSENGAHLYLWLNGPVYEAAGKGWISLAATGPWYSSGHYYEINGEYYTYTNLSSKSQSITTKLSDDAYQTLFKVDVGDYGPVYYTVITKNLQ